MLQEELPFFHWLLRETSTTRGSLWAFREAEQFSNSYHVGIHVFVSTCVCAVKVGQSLSWALFECVAAKFPTQSPGEVLRCLGEV